MSLRALAMENGTAVSSLIAQSKKEGWQEDRKGFRTGVTVKSLQAMIDGQAGELVSARGEAIDALRKGLARFVSDLAEVKPVRRAAEITPDGEVTKWELAFEPVVRVTPRDLAILIDKVNILSGQPAMISRTETESHVDLGIESLPAEVLAGLAELGRTRSPDARTVGGSPLPRLADPDSARDGA